MQDADKKNNHKLELEDITAMQLMEQVVELDQEIKMKQRWINSRIKLLHELHNRHGVQKEKKTIIENFLVQILPEYP
jgi:hypothetical protein